MKIKFIFLTYFLISFMLGASEEIEFWNYLTGERRQVILELIGKYEQETGNKVNMKSIPFDALQGRFFTLAPRGKGPDLLIGPADWIGSFCTKELLQNINSMVTKEEKEEHMQIVIDNCSYKEGLYGLPVGYHTVALIYNKDMIAKAPENTDEMIEVGKKFTNIQNAEYGLVYDKANYYYHFPWIGGFGGKIIDENNNPTFDTKGQIEAAKFVKKLQEGETLIMPEEVDYNMMMTMFSKGKSPMMINGCWIISQLKESGVNYGIARIPKVSETNLWPKPPLGAEVLMMSSSAKNKKTTIDFMKFMTSYESQLLLADYGFIPSINKLYESEDLKKSQYYEHLLIYRDFADISVPMPLAPEMNVAIWGEGISMLASIFSGDNTPIDAAKEAQKNAKEAIENWRKNN